MGLARLESRDDQTSAELTGTGVLMGTVDFMAPEQALNSKYADARSDVYSLGCSLFYLMVGRVLYRGETSMQRILADREEPIPTLCESLNEISRHELLSSARHGTKFAPELDETFTRMVAKSADDRFATMRELVAALESLHSGFPDTRAAKFSLVPLASVSEVPALSEVDTHSSLAAQTKREQSSSAADARLSDGQRSRNRRKFALWGAGFAACAVLSAAVLVNQASKVPPIELVVAKESGANVTSNKESASVEPNSNADSSTPVPSSEPLAKWNLFRDLFTSLSDAPMPATTADAVRELEAIRETVDPTWLWPEPGEELPSDAHSPFVRQGWFGCEKIESGRDRGHPKFEPTG